MKASRFFISTLKEAPADAEVASHKLMMRSGMTGKGGLGNWYVPQFMREQGRTFMPIQRLG